MKKILNISLVLVLLLVLTGCSNTGELTSSTSQNESNANKVENAVAQNTTEEEKKTATSIESVDFKVAAEKQMALPEEGDTIAIFKVKNYGEIKVKFFEDIAPKAVENFTTHAKEGYYDGVTFHRVIGDFMIQGGDPEGTGRGGESIWGKGFPEELAYELVPYRGSLCMASAGTGTSSLGSQFFITQANYSETIANYMTQYQVPEGLIEQYKEYGGDILSLYLNYTVFGQVYEGMDVVDKIAKVQTLTEEEGQADKPVKDVVIEKIEVTTYKAK